MVDLFCKCIAGSEAHTWERMLYDRLLCIERATLWRYPQQILSLYQLMCALSFYSLTLHVLQKFAWCEWKLIALLTSDLEAACS